jgi:hypothetical protein
MTAVATASDTRACHSRKCRAHRHKGRVLWRGDYKTGDFSQWWLNQFAGGVGCGGICGPAQIGSGSASIVTSPVAQGRYAAAFVDGPHTGTDPCNCDRSEVAATQKKSGGYPGKEWYYGWRTDFPGPKQEWWSRGNAWNDIVQFGSTDNSGGWIYFGVDDTTGRPHIYMQGPTGHYRLARLRYDHWYHFVFRVRWSIDPASGFFQLWLDGVKKIRLTHTDTLKPTTVAASPLFTAPGMYLSEGIYRDGSDFTNTVIQDGMCRASSYATAARC